MPKMRYSAPLPALIVSPSSVTIFAFGPERLGLRHAIALDQDHRDHDEHERDQLAERLRELARGLGIGFGVRGLAFGHA